PGGELAPEQDRQQPERPLLLLGGQPGRPVLGDEVLQDLAAVPDVVLADVVEALELVELGGGSLGDRFLDETVGRPRGPFACGQRHDDLTSSASSPKSSSCTVSRMMAGMAIGSSRASARRRIFSTPPRMKRAAMRGLTGRRSLASCATRRSR